MNSPHHSPGHPTRIGNLGSPAPDIRRGETVTYVDPAGNYSNPRPASGGYLVPSGLAKKAEEAAREPEPTVVDAIAQDAAPPEYPDGTPEFLPLYKLGFAQRAEAFELFDTIQASMESMPKKGDTLTPKQAANMYRVLDQLDRFLMFVAVDPEAYKAWEGRHQDAVFSQAWAAYQARMQPGEAKRSSS